MFVLYDYLLKGKINDDYFVEKAVQIYYNHLLRDNTGTDVL